jgi:hypothetical protein
VPRHAHTARGRKRSPASAFHEDVFRGARLWDCRHWELSRDRQFAGDVGYVIKAFCVRVSETPPGSYPPTTSRSLTGRNQHAVMPSRRSQR